MATSGTIGFTVTAEEIVQQALELMGVLSEGETPNPEQLAAGMRTLNMLVKTWQAEGLNLFAVQSAYLFLAKGQKEYNLSSNSQDHFSLDISKTTTAVDAGVTDNNVLLTDWQGIEAGDSIGIVMTNGAIHWSTVTTTPVTSSVLFDDALTGDVKASSTVFTYKTNANRPMYLLEAYLGSKDGSETSLEILPRRDYNELTSSSSGKTTQIYYDPQIGTGKLSVWPVPSNNEDYIRLIYQRTLEDFATSSNTPDFPQEWYMPLSTNLAMYESPKYGIPQMDYQRIQAQALMMKDVVQGFDTELGTSITFQPEWR